MTDINLSWLSASKIVALVNDHVGEYNNVVAKLAFFLKSTSIDCTSPISTVNGTKRVSTEPLVNVVAPLDKSNQSRQIKYFNSTICMKHTHQN